MYSPSPWGPRKNKAGEAFERRCTTEVMEVLAARGFASLPHNVGWDFYIIWYFPKLENAGWQKEGKGGRWNRRDVDGPLKLMLDSVFRAIAEDDSSNIDLHVRKRDGHGSAFAQFVLQEKELMPEEPNTTELAQKINARKSCVRVTTADHPALIDYYATQHPDSDEIRYTSFDMWRFEIMSKIYRVFDKVQHNLDCPAQTGQLDACFDCTDLMVMNCILSNPLTVNQEGLPVGMFDLCETRKGLHVRRVDREEGEMMSDNVPEDKTPPDPQSFVIGAAQQMLKVVDTPKLVLAVLKTAYTMLTHPKLKGSQEAHIQEGFLRMGVLLVDAVAVGCPKPPTKPAYWYKDITFASLPAEYREGLKADKSAYAYAVKAYAAYKQQCTAWMEAGGDKKTETPAAEAAAPAKDAKRKTKRGKKDAEEFPVGDLPAELPAPTQAPQAPPQVPQAYPRALPPLEVPGQLPLPLPTGLAPLDLPPGAPRSIPPVVTDASIPGPPPPDMPKMQPILPTTRPRGSTVKVDAARPQEQVEEQETVEDISLHDVMQALSSIDQKVEKVNGNLKKLAEYFAKVILPAIQKSGAKKK